MEWVTRTGASFPGDDRRVTHADRGRDIAQRDAGVNAYPSALVGRRELATASHLFEQLIYRRFHLRLMSRMNETFPRGYRCWVRQSTLKHLTT